jgi:hypothetical protein
VAGQHRCGRRRNGGARPHPEGSDLKGIDADGREITLTADQEHAVRAMLTWHRHGMQVTIPPMGKQGGKTIVMHTVAWYTLENIEVPPPLA